ncbi:hypothetical protein CHGG_10849 [Chaetomium globosum CBS 148.51]|uniref:Inositol-1-monophosphatase n=1 Tax=Chaetomium globosum (strain ATCC 6205 / CBS 148.51 / DSM 1962 / NBRC 6347 / NRRL 1970) TaxID=306901 RepID=Q2GMF5_CHAGB|nr:uncharacterized protein CHGG_10849 [Chaetomium globosum CBS 148.51]EAQ83031.1 hypothetical protein CHGG_10849 [Chaetomium globosum CBS 148.51]
MHTKSLTEGELDEIYAFAVQLGKDAGKLLLDAAQSRFNGENTQEVVEKDSSVDIVTKTDEDVEAFIKTSIHQQYPDHAFIGEETYSQGTSRAYLISNTTPTWCVDPLDGTVNYTHLVPMFCVSIAFIVHGQPAIGVICAPLLSQLFTSCRGRGAWLNETQRLPLVRCPVPPMPVDAPRGATLDLAYTAMGAFDIWWEGGCWEWDVAAGIAILQEAGGLVTTANPPKDPATARIEDVGLGSRLYLAIRPAGPSTTESGREGQERTVREVWRRVRELDYTRPAA